MANINFIPVTSNYDKLDDLVKIYEEAFPANEREISIDRIIKVSEESDAVRIYAVEEDGNSMSASA